MNIKTGDVKMIERCMRCGKHPDNNLPMCSTCRLDMKDFQTLADFLNKFDGDKRDALWLISSEIADRQSLVISSCKIVHDETGTRLEAPSGKPFTQQKIGEIEKLYKAKNILKRHFGV
jgi:hypothetical protein